MKEKGDETVGDKERKRVLCFGLVMADVLVSGMEVLPRDWEETVGGKRSMIAVGGGATNSARTFGKLGEQVDLLGRVGGDYFGEFVRQETMSYGVNCKALYSDEAHSTGVAVGLVHTDGQRCFVTAQGANREIDGSDFERVDLEDYDFIHINGFFQFPKVEQDLRAILGPFRERGGLVSLDTSGSDPFGRWFAALEPFVDCIDYLFLNETQLRKMSGENDLQKGAEKMLSYGVGHMIVKLGPKGCLVFNGLGEEPIHVSAPRVEAIDTTGAGDSFDAAYVMGLRRGWDTVRCAQFANTVAGLNCTMLGATAGVPTWDEAMARMQEFYGPL